MREVEIKRWIERGRDKVRERDGEELKERDRQMEINRETEREMRGREMEKK